MAAPTSTPRRTALQDIAARPRTAAAAGFHPETNGRAPAATSSYFGCNTFGARRCAQSSPLVYDQLGPRSAGKNLDAAIAPRARRSIMNGNEQGLYHFTLVPAADRLTAGSTTLFLVR